MILDDLRALVECESPSTDLAAVARSAQVAAQIGAGRLGVEPEVIVVDGCTHLRWRFGEGPSRVLLVCHHDTVWPLGSLEAHPFSVTDGVLRGPGCFDMLAGIVIALHALAGIEPEARDGVTLLVTGDEEIGSLTSRKLIEQEARGARAALVLEASADGGALKLERKGAALYEVAITGRAAHSGLDPERGVNALAELSHQVLAVGRIGDPSLGTTVTPTQAWAGTAANTVPATASFLVDARVPTAAEHHRVAAAMAALEPVLPGAEVRARAVHSRPPLEADASAGLFAQAQRVAARLGLPPLLGAAVGGGSDGNFTAGIGTPTLDGLGAVGGGAHAADEHVLVAEIAPRIALVRGLVLDLLEDER